MQTIARFVLLAAFLASAAAAEERPLPGGWFLHAEPSVNHYRIGLDRETRHEGKSAGILESLAAESQKNHYARLVQSIDASKYHGKRLRLSAFLKTQDVTETARLSVESPHLYSDSSDAFYQEPPLRGSNDWRRYEIEFTVPAAGVVKQIDCCVNLYGPGRVWVDDVSLEVICSVKDAPPAVAPAKDAAESSPALFDELANGGLEQTQLEYDLSLMQGKWEIKYPAKGKTKIIEIAREVLEVRGNKITFTNYSQNNGGNEMFWQQLDYAFDLEQSGRVSLLTLRYESIKGRGDSHPYTVNRSQFVEVFQLLDGNQGPPILKQWNRMAK